MESVSKQRQAAIGILGTLYELLGCPQNGTRCLNGGKWNMGRDDHEVSGSGMAFPPEGRIGLQRRMWDNARLHLPLCPCVVPLQDLNSEWEHHERKK